MDKPIIKEPKGIAKRMSKLHDYDNGHNILTIKTKIMTEKEIVTTDSIKKGEGPQNSEITKTSTLFTVIFDYDKSEKTIQIDGEKGDEACLAELGYYLADYDEMEEAKKIKRLVDIARFL